MPESRFSIERICQLARIEVDPEERDRIQQDLERVLDFVAVLDELDLKDVDPFFGASELQRRSQESGQCGPTRDDVFQPSSDRKAILKNSPTRDAEFYLVPPVFE